MNPSQFWTMVFNDPSKLGDEKIIYKKRGVDYLGNYILDKFYTYLPGYASNLLDALKGEKDSDLFILKPEMVTRNGKILGSFKVNPKELAKLAA